MTIKSKAFKFLLGIAVVLAVAVTASLANAADFGTATLRVGSRGAAVIEVQKLVGVTPDGVYGPMTEAAVKAWQLNNGITPVDGIVGSITKAAMSSSPLLGTFPAGCTSNEGFSSTTGLSCAVVVGTLPAGCTSTVGFSPTTGQSCSVVTTLPAGCTSTVGYSSTTGAKCDGGSTPGTTGPLVGGEGDITVSDFTSGTETTIGEGKSEKVLGVKVEADNGSDVSLSTMKVVIDGWDDGADNKGSSRLERHIDGVDIYMGSTKVGSADVEDFSKNNGVYTKSISLSNAVIRKGDSAKFYVSVKAASSIDSENEDNTWDVDVTSIRFQDAMGVVMTVVEDGSTFDVAAATIGFESATANDKITTLSSSSNPDDTTLLVDADGVSEEYMVLAFKLKVPSDSSDLNVLEVPITIKTKTANVENVISDIYLKVGSKVYDDFDVKDGDKKEAVYTFTIDEGDFSISGGDTVEVKVYADFLKEGSTYNTGETVIFKLDARKMLIENDEGDSVTSPTTNRESGTLTLSTAAASIGSYSWTVSSTGTMVDFYFTVDNTDGEEEFVFDTTEIVDTLGGGSTAFVVADTANDHVTGTLAGTVTKYSGDTVGLAGSKYTVSAGDSTTFRIRYSVGSDNATPAAAADNGIWLEVKITTVAGETVTDSKQTSPTATVNL